MRIAPQRRWFRFSLRTLFVVVTVVGLGLGWLAWNVNIVRQRMAMRAEIVAEHIARTQIMYSIEDRAGAIAWHAEEVQHAPSTPMQLSLVRRLLRDDLYPLIHRNKKEDALRSLRLFPEAQITYYAGPFKGIAAQTNRVIEQVYRSGSTAMPSASSR